ncbi:MAG: ATP-binding protein [Bacteroidales bacterium]|nr:ATP-binding protein [Bacteroidales bacterium]
MELAFSYDRSVTGKQFLGRKSECERLLSAILAGENIALFSAPKSGKSSLISQVLLQLKEEGKPVSFCKVQAGNAIRIEDFLGNFARQCGEMFHCTLPAPEGVVNQEACEAVLIAIVPQIRSRQGERFVIQIEDFQRLDSLEQSDRFMRAFRRLLEETKDDAVSFLLTGSQLNAMKALFTKSPFFGHLVRVITLSRVEEQTLYDYVRKNLDVTGKVMERDDIYKMIRLLDRNVWYVKHYMAMCDSMTRGYVNAAVMDGALSALISSQLPYFQYIASTLTCFQLRFLKALIDNGPRCNFSSARVMTDYGLNSSANVVRVRDALLKKEIITQGESGGWYFIDPLLRYWFEHYFFQ